MTRGGADPARRCGRCGAVPEGDGGTGGRCGPCAAAVARTRGLLVLGAVGLLVAAGTFAAFAPPPWRAATDEARAAAGVAASARREAAAAAARAEALAAEVEAVRREVAGLSALVAAAGRAVERLGIEIDEVAQSVRDERAAREAAASAASGADAAARPLTAAEEEACLARMDDLNPGTRLSALVLLRRGQGAAARAAALRGLADDRPEVRAEAARLCGRLDIRESLPDLVRALGAPGAYVRAAALDALVAMEGTDLGFDPLAPEAEREAAVARWRARVAGR